jgi:osmotically-inducible protein OsmY
LNASPREWHVVNRYCLSKPISRGCREGSLIADAAAARLRQAPYLELRHVNCTFQQGILYLQGHVSSCCLRQIAQALIQGLEGVEAIDNQLEVRLAKNRRL